METPAFQKLLIDEVKEFDQKKYGNDLRNGTENRFLTPHFQLYEFSQRSRYNTRSQGAENCRCLRCLKNKF